MSSGYQDKVRKVMHEFKHGQLHSGSKSGPLVKNRKQAIAIALNQARREYGTPSHIVERVRRKRKSKR